MLGFKYFVLDFLNHKYFKYLIHFILITLIATILALFWLARLNPKPEGGLLLQPNLSSAVVVPTLNKNYTVFDISNRDRSYQDRTFAVSMTNLVTFSPTDIPKIVIRNFQMVGNKSRALILDEDRSYGAKDWLSGSTRLINLAQGEDNALEFSLSIPDDQEAGSYAAAIILLNRADQELGRHLLIFNLNKDLRKISSAEIEISLQNNLSGSKDKMPAFLVRNQSPWLVNPNLIISPITQNDIFSDQSQISLKALSFGILPKHQQLYEIEAEFETFWTQIKQDSDWQGRVVVRLPEDPHFNKIIDLRNLFKASGEQSDSSFAPILFVPLNIRPVNIIMPVIVIIIGILSVLTAVSLVIAFRLKKDSKPSDYQQIQSPPQSPAPDQPLTVDPYQEPNHQLLSSDSLENQARSAQPQDPDSD